MRPRGAKTWVEIDRSALRHNADQFRRLAKTTGSQLMAVVKSNAYGHGLAETVRSLEAGGCDWYGVDALPEALAVRAAGAKQPLLILGHVPPESLPTAVARGFSLTVYDRVATNALTRSATARHPAKLHLKIETGTWRQGVTLEQLPAFARHLKRQPHLRIEGLSTHFANIEDTVDPSYARRQLKAYVAAVDIVTRIMGKKPLCHTAASAAALLYPETRLDVIRAGISLYGLWPSRETQATLSKQQPDFTLRPALSWKTVVAQVKSAPTGAAVSYGLTERVTRPSKLAVLPIGYWDGFDRKLSSVANVLIRGHRAKVVGRVCMNMCVVDVTDIPGARVGDEAVVIGRQGSEVVTAEEFAAKCGTINYEAVTRINPTLPRQLV